MSQPPYPFMPYSGQQVQGQHQQSYTAAPPFQGSSLLYQTPQDATHLAGTFAVSNTSFEFNGSRIPGLRMSGRAASLQAPPLQVENQSSWSHNMTPSIPSLMTPTKETSDSAKAAILSAPYTSKRPTQPEPTHVSVTSMNNHALEEGELSEGEFEDLYEPRGPNDSPNAGNTGHSAPYPRATEDTTGSVGDADGSSIYDTGSAREEVLVDSTSASLPAIDEEDGYEPSDFEPQSRERSGSYSPYLSPSELHSRATAASFSNETRQPGSTSIRQSSLTGPNSNGINRPRQTPHLSSGHQRGNSRLNEGPPSQAASAPKNAYKSVLEAKKKAQEAILGLWPLKIRYQNYLDEGLDPGVLKSLFTDLGLDTSPQKSSASVSHAPDAPTASPTSRSVSRADPIAIQPDIPTLTHKSPESTNITTTEQQPLQPTLDSEKPNGLRDSPAGQKKTAQEERKDRIARMLAEKKKKAVTIPVAPLPKTAPSAPSPPRSGLASINATVQTESAKAKLRAENTIKLQQKLAALKKAQEEAEAKKKQDQPMQSGPDEAAGEVENTRSGSLANTSNTQRQVAHDSTATESDNVGTSVAKSDPSGVSTPQQGVKSRTNKRPIASDFDAYPTNGAVLKRTRTQDTLIIDVSDDEDVEMDLGSPTDGPNDMLSNSTFSARQAVLATFPPLSNSHTWRGPRSGPGTPAAGTPSGRGQQLDVLQQRIERTKRMIAEAEAKKTAAAKKYDGLSTSITESPASAIEIRDALRLPKTSEAVKTPNHDRRDRIASYQLPVLDAALKEKQEKLMRLRLEAVELEAEVNASLAERQKLTAELQDLESIDRPSSDLSDAQSGIASPIPDVSAPQELAAQLSASATNSSSFDPTQLDQLDASKAEILAASASEKSEMDLDSSNDSEEVTEHADAVHSEIVDSAESESHLSPHVMIETAPVHDNYVPADGGIESEQNFGTNEADASLQGVVIMTDKTNDDCDENRHIPDLEVSISDANEAGDAETSALLQISDMDPAQAQENAVREIPDEDPYEPSLAQAPDVAAKPAQEASNGENRSSVGLSTKYLPPYQSPLKYFRAYRFHPHFLEDVPGGLKSVTYSSKIDVSRPICPSVTDGGECPNGPNCGNQHFDTMVLSDTAIIAELGSTDMYTGEQKGRFIEGLKKVLNDLKTNKIKDFDRITKAIIQYRADFLQDKSRVLALNNVTI